MYSERSTRSRIKRNMRWDDTLLDNILIFSSFYNFHSRKPGRSLNLGDYRFGASNGQEMIDEISGTSNHYTAEFWEYNPRLGRRWETDPVIKYHESSYAAFSNNPIFYIDPNGDNADWYQSENGSVIWKEGDAETIEVNDETFNNIGTTYSENIDENTAIFFDQNNSTLVDRPTTFKGYENNRFQKWDGHISYFSQQYGGNMDLVKSIMIQETGFSDYWFTNDPMQMFHPGDYSPAKFGLKNKEDARSRHQEKDPYKNQANGALSIQSGISWLYNQKKSLANTNRATPDWLQNSFLSYPLSWRMAFRYNGSYTLLNTACDGNLLPRAFIYAERVHRRAIIGGNTHVPTGTSNFNWDTDFYNKSKGSWGIDR